jgi:hypothetical protein
VAFHFESIWDCRGPAAQNNAAICFAGLNIFLAGSAFFLWTMKVQGSLESKEPLKTKLLTCWFKYLRKLRHMWERLVGLRESAHTIIWRVRRQEEMCEDYCNWASKTCHWKLADACSIFAAAWLRRWGKWLQLQVPRVKKSALFCKLQWASAGNN